MSRTAHPRRRTSAEPERYAPHLVWSQQPRSLGRAYDRRRGFKSHTREEKYDRHHYRWWNRRCEWHSTDREDCDALLGRYGARLELHERQAFDDG